MKLIVSIKEVATYAKTKKNARLGCVEKPAVFSSTLMMVYYAFTPKVAFLCCYV